MNARDSEKLLGVLEQIGYQEETNEEEAEFCHLQYMHCAGKR